LAPKPKQMRSHSCRPRLKRKLTLLPSSVLRHKLRQKQNYRLNCRHLQTCKHRHQAKSW